MANLFMHYAFDTWMLRTHRGRLLCRYAGDGLVHCRSQREAERILEQIGRRLSEIDLEIPPEKSGIVYCKDSERKGTLKRVSFDFLGYSFRPRRSLGPGGRLTTNFCPAVSRMSVKSITQTIRS